MTTSTSPRSCSDLRVDEVEKDLWRWLDILTDDSDLLVVLGLVAARIVDASVLDEIATTEPGAKPFDFAEHGISEADFSRFQKLWYHFRVPYARASLVWWYLFCLALGRGDDVVHALARMTEWLGLMTDDINSAMVLAGDICGLSAEIVVVTDTEMTDLAALVAAVRLNAPLIAVDDVSAAVEIGRNSDRAVVAPTLGDGRVQDRAHDELWLGPPVNLRALPARARQAWQRLPDQERTDLLSGLEQRISSIERVRFLIDEAVVDNRGVTRLLAECRNEPVADWPQERLALATLAWCWQEAGFVLQELNQSFVSFPALAVFLTRKIRQYRGRLPEIGTEQQEGDDVMLLARELSGLRKQIEDKYERCLSFDGSNWERREFLLPLSIYRRTQEVPESLRAHLHSEIGAEFLGRMGTLTAWDQFLESALEAGSSPTRIMQEFAHWAANARDLRVDLAIFTVPVGRKLDQPWTMDFTDLFCYTGFRDGFRPEDFGIPMDRVGMYNVIAQRMRYNAVKKAQNYAPVMRFPPQGFNLPDIAVAEDANHGGHNAAGIRLACRLPISIAHDSKSWNGISDVRLNRAQYSRDNRFQPRDMITGHRYTQWAKGVADATYRRGLSFDEKWTNKVKDLEL
ncbi:MAG TPA: hypothetical protein VFW69_24565 [Mycobacterium sp.]|nr:hypothetical protein [Mycobacterium sp.]